jgi:hypothetical protein
MPVQGGPGGPLDYAPWRARLAGTTGASTASPPQELPDKSPQIVTFFRDDRRPGASLGMLSSRDTLLSRGGVSLRDASSQEGASSRGGLAAQDSLLSPDTLPPRSWQPLRDSLPSRDVLFLRDAPRLRPTLLPKPPLACAKMSIFASIARVSSVVLAAGGALGFLWVAMVSLRGTTRPEARDVVAERARDPPAAAEQAAATGAALYQDFLKWRLQRLLQGR